MKYTEQEIKELIEKEFKTPNIQITETEDWLKIVSNTGSLTLGKGAKQEFYKQMKEEFLKNNHFKIQANEQ